MTSENTESSGARDYQLRLEPGEKVVIYSVGSRGLYPSVTFDVIDRVLKRDVVLASGERFNKDRMSRSHGGTWDGWTEELRHPDDPVVIQALAKIAEAVRRKKVADALYRAVDLARKGDIDGALRLVRKLADQDEVGSDA